MKCMKQLRKRCTFKWWYRSFWKLYHNIFILTMNHVVIFWNRVILNNTLPSLIILICFDTIRFPFYNFLFVLIMYFLLWYSHFSHENPLKKIKMDYGRNIKSAVWRDKMKQNIMFFLYDSISALNKNTYLYDKMQSSKNFIKNSTFSVI